MSFATSLLRGCLVWLLCLASLSVSAGKAGTRVTLHTTIGDLVLRLYDDTPIHRDNFLNMVESGHLDGKTFGRIVRDFMVQCGPEQTEQNLPAEIHYPRHYHKRGALAMGRSGDDPNHTLESNALQFYLVWGKVSDEDWITRSAKTMKRWSYGRATMKKRLRRYYMKHAGAPYLDGSFTVFGQLVEGFDVLDAIQSAPANTETEEPLAPVTIVRAEVSGR